MMRKKILLLALLLCFATTAMALVDEFSGAVNFLTASYPQGLWEGVIVSGGVSGTQDGSINLLNTTAKPGALRFDTTLTNWENADDDGAFLYATTSGDFRMTTKISDGQFPSLPSYTAYIGYMSAGLMVRDAVAANADWIYFNAFDRPDWGATYQFRRGTGTTAGGGVQNNGASTVGANPWMRIERIGDGFFASKSADGINWTQLFNTTDTNMPSSVQVGLAHAIFSGASGWVEFDFFKVGTKVAALSGNTPVDEEGATSTTITVDLTGPAQTAQVDVVISEISADANDLLLDGVQSPLTLSFPVGVTQQTFTVQAIDDDLQEGPVQVSLIADVFSTDINYNGNYGNTLKISVADNDQGTLVIDEGDGLLVDEDELLSDSFTVRLSLPLAAAGTVTVNISTDGQVAISPTQLIFTDLDWNVAQSVTVTGVDDAVLENDPHDGAISFSISSADLAYAGNIVVPSITASVQENECGAWGYSAYDYNQDCVVNLADLAVLASQWTQCTSPYAAGCIDVR